MIKQEIIIKVNINKDASNWWHACHKISYGVDWKSRINKRLKNKIVGKTKKQAFKFLIPYLKKLYKRINIEKEREFVQHFFDENNKKIFEKMERVTDRKIYHNDFTCFLTTFPRAPYNAKSGHIGLPVIWGRKSYINVFLHELLHFQTIYYFKRKILKKLNKKEFENLKEALTVILNDAFKDLLTQKDKGYGLHKNLRNELFKFWHKNRNFEKLINYGIKIYP